MGQIYPQDGSEKQIRCILGLLLLRKTKTNFLILQTPSVIKREWKGGWMILSAQFYVKRWNNESTLALK